MTNKATKDSNEVIINNNEFTPPRKLKKDPIRRAEALKRNLLRRKLQNHQDKGE